MKKINLFSLSLLLVSCAGIKIENKKQDRSVVKERGLMYDYYIPYIKYSSTPVDIKDYCKDQGWQSLEMSNNFLTGIVPLVTLGLVRPQRVTIECYREN
jgi:hypothetical protein